MHTWEKADVRRGCSHILGFKGQGKKKKPEIRTKDYGKLFL